MLKHLFFAILMVAISAIAPAQVRPVAYQITDNDQVVSIPVSRPSSFGMEFAFFRAQDSETGEWGRTAKVAHRFSYDAANATFSDWVVGGVTYTSKVTSAYSEAGTTVIQTENDLWVFLGSQLHREGNVGRNNRAVYFDNERP